MMLEIAYDEYLLAARLKLLGSSDPSWFDILLRNLQDHDVDVQRISDIEASVPWGQFLNARNVIINVSRFGKVSIHPIGEAVKLLSQAKSRVDAFHNASDVVYNEDDVVQQLESLGFLRKLTDNQLHNVTRIAGLPAAATFSVPGAGKTTEALAYYILRKNNSDILLVIAPKNALGAWDEQLLECLGPDTEHFTRLRFGESNIEQTLKANTSKYLIITYQQFSRGNVPQLISNFIATKRVFVFLDESHRIKGQGITSTTVRSISYLPVGKLILSGTPMPQSTDDLLPQFEFLYPEIQVNSDNVVESIKPIFVRTTKSQLGLPEPKRIRVPVGMLAGQRKLYDLLKKEVVRQAEATLTARDRNSFRNLGRSVMRVLQLVSNPALLVNGPAQLPDYFYSIIDEGDSPKIEYTCLRARQVANKGNKVLIWSSFRNNVEIIASRLSDLGSVYIHGGVDAGSQEDDNTREGRILQFHENDDCMVMVANPAAAGEGISLHKVCHHAIYVDRTFNAAHYLQSEDRIHRLGTTISPVIEIVQCTDSIDQTVASRLETKSAKMGIVLEDPGLSITPKNAEYLVDEDEEEDPTLGMDFEDVMSIIENMREN